MKINLYRQFFKAFSNKTRLEIISLLRSHQKNVSQIVKSLGYEQSRISHNLRCLEQCGFVISKSNGKERFYRLDKSHIIPILNQIDKHIERYSKRLKECEIIK